MHAARLIVVLACAVASVGASCSTVGPTSPGIGAAPLTSSRPTALGASTIAAIGQSGSMQGLDGTTQTSIAVAGTLARRLTLTDGFSLDLSASAAGYRSTMATSPVPVAGVGARLWLGPDGSIPLGVELAALARLDSQLLAPGFRPDVEARLLAAYRLPGRACLFLTTRPGLYGWSFAVDPRWALLELPIGATFDVGMLRVGAEVGIDVFPAGGVWGARANASAAATF